MEVLRDGVVAFLAAVGLASLLALAAGPLFRTGRPLISGLLLVLPLTGEAPALEADLRALRQVQEKLPGARIVLADRGLTPETRRLARYLAERDPGAVLTEENGPIMT